MVATCTRANQPAPVETLFRPNGFHHDAEPACRQEGKAVLIAGSVFGPDPQVLPPDISRYAAIFHVCQSCAGKLDDILEKTHWLIMPVFSMGSAGRWIQWLPATHVFSP